VIVDIVETLLRAGILLRITGKADRETGVVDGRRLAVDRLQQLWHRRRQIVQHLFDTCVCCCCLAIVYNSCVVYPRGAVLVADQIGEVFRLLGF
jgi:hypothetical protein